MKQFNYIPVLFLLIVCSLKAQPEGGFRNYYTGTMDDSSKFQMDLIIETDHVQGIFYSQSADSPLYMEGEPSTDEGKFQIRVFDEKDSLKGQILCFISPFKENLSGTYLNKTENRSRNFQMQKIAEYVQLDQGDAFIRAEAHIPQFLFSKTAWQQLNLSLNDINSDNVNYFVADEQDRLIINKSNIFRGWQYFTDYIIRYYSDDFVSLLIRTEQYTVSDKPRINYASDNIIVTDTGFRSIKLSELFLPNTNYIQRLSDYIIKDLKDQKAAWAENGEINNLSEQDLRTFAITPHYIEFTFPPNTVAPDEMDSWLVRIPYTDISVYINPEGLLKRFLRFGVDYYNLVPGNK